jgi:hypothetical protein
VSTTARMVAVMVAFLSVVYVAPVRPR